MLYDYDIPEVQVIKPFYCRRGELPKLPQLSKVETIRRPEAKTERYLKKKAISIDTYKMGKIDRVKKSKEMPVFSRTKILSRQRTHTKTQHEPQQFLKTLRSEIQAVYFDSDELDNVVRMEKRNNQIEAKERDVQKIKQIEQSINRRAESQPKIKEIEQPHQFSIEISPIIQQAHQNQIIQKSVNRQKPQNQQKILKTEIPLQAQNCSLNTNIYNLIELIKIQKQQHCIFSTHSHKTDRSRKERQLGQKLERLKTEGSQERKNKSIEEVMKVFEQARNVASPTAKVRLYKRVQRMLLFRGHLKGEPTSPKKILKKSEHTQRQLKLNTLTQNRRYQNYHSPKSIKSKKLKKHNPFSKNKANKLTKPGPPPLPILNPPIVQPVSQNPKYKKRQAFRASKLQHSGIESQSQPSQSATEQTPTDSDFSSSRLQSECQSQSQELAQQPESQGYIPPKLILIQKQDTTGHIKQQIQQLFHNNPGEILQDLAQLYRNRQILTKSVQRFLGIDTIWPDQSDLFGWIPPLPFDYSILRPFCGDEPIDLYPEESKPFKGMHIDSDEQEVVKKQILKIDRSDPHFEQLCQKRKILSELHQQQLDCRIYDEINRVLLF